MALDLSQIPAPQVIENINFDRLLELIRVDLFKRDPNYIRDSEADPLHLNMEGMAYIMDLFFEKVNAAVASVLITHATGADLENLGALFSLTRMPQEIDDDFRVRIANHLEAIVAGSIVWYQQYVRGVTVVEVTGDENIVDEIPTPVLSTVKDAHVILTPNPSYDDSQAISATNLPEVPGSINIYVQTNVWRDPRTDVLTQVIPSSRMLQTVRNYIHAVGQNETDRVREEAAQERRFLGDTVYVLPAEVHPYVFCVIIYVVQGLNNLDVLDRVAAAAREFVLSNERVGRRIPLSDFYKVVNTDEVTEVNLEYPTGDIVPAENAVPVVFAEHPLSVQSYESFSTTPAFASGSGEAWTLNGLQLLFRVPSDSQDKVYLDYLRLANRIAVRALDDEGLPTGMILHTYRVSGPPVTRTITGNIYYELTLVGTPTATGLVDGTDYDVRILDSIEVQLGS